MTLIAIPDMVDHVIPGNDDALRAIRLFTSRIADSILEGRQAAEDKRLEEEKVAAEKAAEELEQQRMARGDRGRRNTPTRRRRICRGNAGFGGRDPEVPCRPPFWPPRKSLTGACVRPKLKRKVGGDFNAGPAGAATFNSPARFHKSTPERWQGLAAAFVCREDLIQNECYPGASKEIA